MKKLLSMAVLLGAAHGVIPHASAKTIYTEDWGNANTSVRANGTLNLLGWTGVAQSQTAQPFLGIFGATSPNDPTLGLPLPANVVFFTGLSLPSPATAPGQTNGPGMFYTTDTAGAGSAGDSAFADIDPTQFTNLTFNVEVRNAAGNLTNYFAIQTTGGSWFVATNNPLPRFTGGFPTFTNWTMVYTNAAAVWNNLTIDPSGTFVTIGSTAAANLSGMITGIGIVELNDTNFAANNNGFNYSQIVINQGLSDFPSNPPTNSGPAVTPQTVFAGGGASFLPGFAGSPNLIFRWKTNGVNVPNSGRYIGATSNMLTITNVNANDAIPTYSVVVTNFFGAATNDGLTLVVNPTPPDMLYSETLPFLGPSGGNLPLTGVGWVAAGTPATGNGIFQNGPGLGIFFSFSGNPTTNIYYTTTTNDTGLSGLPFVAINPASFPAVTFQAQFAPGNGAGTTRANVTVYWAVQMAGSNWFSSVASIPTSLVQGQYNTNQFAFSTVASNWNNLTVSTNSVVTIGSVASSALIGNITGAGLVFVHNNTSGASMNFENFELSTNAVSILAPTIGFAGSPFSQTAAAGGGVSFGVSATGTAPFTYGWTLNGNHLSNGGRISGATSPTLTIANLNMNDAGAVVAFVTNSVGTDESDFYVGTSLNVTNPAVGILYSETFPFVGPLPGNYPISASGWAEAAPNVPNAVFQNGGGSDAAAFAFLGSAGTTVYYTSTASDTNQAGLPFPNINVASYPDLTLNIDLQPGFQATNVTASFAVEMNGSNWFMAATPLPVPGTGGYATYSLLFDPTAANWKNLTVTGSGGIIGSTAASKLTGVMTGAGVVYVTVGSGGDINFDNMLVTGTGLGGVNVGSLSGGNLNLSWVGNPAVNLQSNTNLTTTNWQDVPNSLGLYSLPVPTTGPQKFFRLIQH